MSTLTDLALPLPETTVARCELTELLVDQCGHCRGIEDPQVVRARRSALARLARLIKSEVPDA